MPAAPPRDNRPRRFAGKAPRSSVWPALVLAALLATACGTATVAQRVVASTPVAATALPATVLPGTATATPLPPTATAPPATATPAPSATAVPATATTTPNHAATAGAQAAANAAATRGANAARAVEHLGAGNTLRQAGNLDGALHEYATAQADAPDRADVRSAIATAQAMVTAQAPATPAPILPLRLQIPAIGVNAPIEYVGLTADGAMDVPQGWWDAGWFKFGPTPGQPGNAVIDGHLDSTTGPAVFWHLGDLGPGGQIVVTLSDGGAARFVIRQRISYAYNDAPLDRIFGAAGSANLNLITCGGSWNFFQHNYSNRTVIYAQKVS